LKACPRCLYLKSRETELLSAHALIWLKEDFGFDFKQASPSSPRIYDSISSILLYFSLRNIPNISVEWSRGFPELITISSHAWMRNADDWKWKIPILKVFISDTIFPFYHRRGDSWVFDSDPDRIPLNIRARDFNMQVADLSRSLLYRRFPGIKFYLRLCDSFERHPYG
jgi:hypothetical protein